MSSTLQSLAVHADAATFSADLPRRRSDKALEVYLSLDPENRPASYQYEDIQLLFPDAARAAELAREAELCYASIAMVTDYDCWHPGHGAVDVAQVIAVLTGSALVLMNVMYSYVCQRNGLAAAWLCQITINLLVDLLYPWLDPRISHTPKVS